MKIRETRVINGRNIHSHRPVIAVTIDLGPYDEWESSQDPAFIERLLKVLPGLEDHHCSLSRPGGFVERLREGTKLGHVLEHTILELQNIAGIGTTYGKTRAREPKGVYEIVFEYKAAQGARACVDLAVSLIKDILAGKSPEITPRVEDVKTVVGRTELGPSTRAVFEAARERGIPVERVGDGSLLILGTGKYQKRIIATIPEDTSSIAVDIACEKALAKEFLKEAGLPVPYGGIVNDEREALTLAAEINRPVVVKPCDGNQGKGVALNLRGEEEILAAFRLAHTYSTRVMLEEFIKGRHYRFLVIGDKVAAVSERIPAHVVGDGRHTIKELVDEVNQGPRRGEAHEKPLTRIKIDPVVQMVLSRQGLTLEHIPPAGKRVFLRENANLSTGGTARDVTDLVHPDNCSLAIRAARSIGLDIAGIDVVLKDITKPLSRGSGAIIEVNAAPGIRMHLYPSSGKARPVGKDIVSHLFPKGATSEIPIVSVTGTNGKTTTTRLISHILERTNGPVGMATSDGVWIGGQCRVRGDTTGPASARMVLHDRSVAAAVLETARGGLIRGGLGYDQSDVAVVTNIGEDHIGQDGINTIEDMAWVKALVVEAVKPTGSVILNALGPFSEFLAGRTQASITYFARNKSSKILRRHLAKGGRAVFLCGREIVLARGDQAVTVGDVTDIPITFSGTAVCNIDNALAAAAATAALGIDVQEIRKGLYSFTPTAEQNPGRQNIFRINDVQVLVDYAHNPGGYQAILQMIKGMPRGETVGVIGVPGDRLNETILRVGHICGAGFDRLFIKEDLDLRGRQPGEVANILRRGALAAGMNPDRITIISDEALALESAVKEAQQGDLVAVFYEEFDRIMETVERLESSPVRGMAERVLLAAGIESE